MENLLSDPVTQKAFYVTAEQKELIEAWGAGITTANNRAGRTFPPCHQTPEILRGEGKLGPRFAGVSFLAAGVPLILELFWGDPILSCVDKNVFNFLELMSSLSIIDKIRNFA